MTTEAKAPKKLTPAEGVKIAQEAFAKSQAAKREKAEAAKAEKKATKAAAPKIAKVAKTVAPKAEKPTNTDPGAAPINAIKLPRIDFGKPEEVFKAAEKADGPLSAVIASYQTEVEKRKRPSTYRQRAIRALGFTLANDNTWISMEEISIAVYGLTTDVKQLTRNLAALTNVVRGALTLDLPGFGFSFVRKHGNVRIFKTEA